MALGVALIVVCALGAFFLFARADHRYQVLVVARQVAPGQALRADDLTVAAVSVGPQVHSVPAGDLSSMMGRRAVFGLTAGALLDAGSLTTDPGVNGDQVVMGVALKSGLFPSTAKAGDAVEVLVVPSSSSGGSSPIGSGGVVAPISARVVDVQPPAANSGESATTVDLVVPKAEAATVAAAAAASQVVLAVGS
jgi:hypothetical protein